MEHKHIEGKGKPLKVVAPEGAIGCITQGKEYVVFHVADFRHAEMGWFFSFIGEHEMSIDTFENESEHLKGGNWIVTEREPEN